MDHDSPLLQFFNVSWGTWSLLLMIAVAALSIVRGHLSSLLATVATLPLILLCSLGAYQLCVAMDWFNDEKMADWLAWTIMAGTAGTVFAVSIVAFAGRFQDRTRTTA